MVGAYACLVSGDGEGLPRRQELPGPHRPGARPALIRLSCRGRASASFRSHPGEDDGLGRARGTPASSIHRTTGPSSGVGREGVRAAMEDLAQERVMVLTGIDL
jgi:hypothetical protein